MSSPSLTPLKSSLHRAVLLDAADRRVIKRFRSQGLLRRLLDPLRARAEARAAAQLRSAGLPVPELLDRRPGDGRCEVHFRQILAAETLEEYRVRRLPKGIPLRLARTLGHCLGLAHAAGLDHHDLHAGNVLLDGEGSPWLIDFQHARVRRGMSSARVALRDLVHLAATAREVHPPSFRLSFLKGWLEGTPKALAKTLPALPELGALIEQRAREHHRNRIHSRSRRWFRASRVTAEIQAPRALLVRRDLQDDAMLIQSLSEATLGQEALTISGRHFEIHSAEREVWRTLARLEDHGVPAARPTLLDERNGLMIFETRKDALDSGARDGLLRRGLPGLLGRLHDRGLDALGPLELVVLDGALAFGVKQQIGVLDPSQRAARFRAQYQEPLTLPAVEAYLAEERGGRAAASTLRAQLESALEN